MRYLMRENAPLTSRQWEQIDQAVVSEARKLLVGRRFLSLTGPLGAQTQIVPVDSIEAAPGGMDFWGNEQIEAGKIASRQFIELATIYSDFIISWRDIENENSAGVMAAMRAAVFCANREDDLILYGNPERQISGLTNAPGINKLPISDWGVGENPITDLAKAIEVLISKGGSGQRVLVISSDLNIKLNRIQTGTGMLESERVKKLVEGGVYVSTRLGNNRAILTYCDTYNLDLVVGQDLITAYLGNEKLDHVFRVMETVVPRIRRPAAIALLE